MTGYLPWEKLSPLEASEVPWLLGTSLAVGGDNFSAVDNWSYPPCSDSTEAIGNICGRQDVVRVIYISPSLEAHCHA